jgi:hypothetical protein
MAMPDESQIAVGTPVTCDIEPGAMHVFASSGQGD